MAKQCQSAITGTCMDMCPSKERLMREKEGLLHRFEWADDTDFTSTVSTSSVRRRQTNNRARKTNRKGDTLKVVKVFARSAAGLDKTSPSDLRPAQVLGRTVEYLYSKILTRKGEPFITIYDFVFDRLRSVRQDIVIQRINDLPAITILESIVRFHVYSAYRCRHEPPTTFDPHINRKHLIDNLKRLLRLYEFNDYWKSSRNEFEALNLILCPSSTEVLIRAMDFRRKSFFKEDSDYQYATEMCLAYQTNNYVKYFKTLKSLPPLMCAAAFESAKSLRGKTLQIIAKAFRSSTCKFPLERLHSLLLYPTIDRVEDDLQYLSVQITKGDIGNPEMFAVFTKSSNFTASRLEGINCDLKPLSGVQNLFEDHQTAKVASIIWPQLSTQSLSSLSEVRLGRDYWFTDSDPSKS